MQCTQKTKKAFALAIVLWIVAALLLGIAFMVSLARDNINLSIALHDKLEARLEAESILETLKYIILTSNYDRTGLLINETLPYKFPKRIILDGRVYKMKNISISLKDASCLLNTIYPNIDLITELSTKKGERELKYEIKDSLQDWIDKDDIVNLNGAEQSFYKLKKGVLYGPRNSSAVQSVYELRLIKGLDKLSKKRWKLFSRYFYYGNGAYTNLLLVDQMYLSKLLKIDFLEAKVLNSYRQSNPKKFIRIVQQNKNYHEEYMGFSPSLKIKIDIIVKNNEAVSELHTFVDFPSVLMNSVGVDQFEIY